MSMELGNLRKDPTPQDLQDIEIRATGLGKGDLVHDIDNHLGILRMLMFTAKRKGWTNNHIQDWDEEVGAINKLIHQVRIEQAKEKGLL